MGHLKNVCMTYVEHARFSFSLSYLFLKACICSFIHAIIHGIFAKTSTNYCKYALEMISSVGCDAKNKIS